MTVLVARRSAGRIELVADSRSVEDSTGAYIDGVQKIWAYERGAFGYSGSVAAFAAAADAYYEMLENLEPEKWGQRMRKIMLDLELKEAESFFDMLVWRDGRLWHLQHDGCVLPIDARPIYAIGSGADIAIGYLHALPSAPLEDAVKATYAYYAGCGGAPQHWRKQGC
ncbi:MAG: hypothetical protein GWN58_58540 [Anaerolineae bacterium]|nr:hypothetical protein [Anaerolineae bacterium]